MKFDAPASILATAASVQLDFVYLSHAEYRLRAGDPGDHSLLSLHSFQPRFLHELFVSHTSSSPD